LRYLLAVEVSFPSAFATGAKPVTIVRVGTNQKYSDGWETAFSKTKSAGKVKTKAKKASAKKPAKKSKKK
jgi:hypothetical protein